MMSMTDKQKQQPQPITLQQKTTSTERKRYRPPSHWELQSILPQPLADFFPYLRKHSCQATFWFNQYPILNPGTLGKSICAIPTCTQTIKSYTIPIHSYLMMHK